MRTFLFNFVLFCFSFCGALAEKPLDRLIDALIQVESNGNPDAVGDNGKAYGILQIHSIMVEDFNRIAKIKGIKVSYSHSDAFDPEISVYICKVVLSYYGRKVIEEKGQITFKDMARQWNGGPQGWKDFSLSNPLKEKNLQNYWRKVEKELNK